MMKGVERGEEYMKATIAKDPAKTADDSFIEVYKRLRDGDLATLDSAREFVRSIFSPERYDLSEIGRHHFNERYGRPIDKKATDEEEEKKEELKALAYDYVLGRTVRQYMALGHVTTGLCRQEADATFPEMWEAAKTLAEISR